MKAMRRETRPGSSVCMPAVMSAFGGRADDSSQVRHCRFRPEADIATSRLRGQAATMAMSAGLEGNMRRRGFIAGLTSTVAMPLVARAQEAGRTYRLGVLSPNPRQPYHIEML